MTDISLGATTLGADINKSKTGLVDGTLQGAASEKLPELSLDMSDEEILKLTKRWKDKWDKSKAKQDWEQAGEENKKYWKGNQYQSMKIDEQRPIVDNLIFESLETFLPQATRRNPDPLVTLADGVEESAVNQAYVTKVKNKLGVVADKNKLRLKLKKAARNWAISLLGVLKYGWDLDRNLPQIKALRPKKVILDPEATIDEDGYSGAYAGEHRKMEAAKMVRIIGKDAKRSTEAIKAITDEVKGEMGTDVVFIEWWTQEYLCWEMKTKILLAMKNPHWKYDSLTPAQTVVDDYGNETQGQPTPVKGINHFEVPKIPFSFLSIFNLGDQPMDETSLISQNLSNQDKINKTNKQITRNVDGMNGGVVVSLERSGLTKPQAKEVTKALREGSAIAIPSGAPGDAVLRLPSPSLPPDVFNQLNDTRTRMRDIFGTRGSSAAGIESEQTVRGKIISRGLDTDRIGGGITEYLEQLADEAYNWFIQLLYVYSDDFQHVTGAEPPKIDVSVKEGSLLPKDSTTIANQAIDLAQSGKMSLIDMYKRLEYPNPEDMAANVWLEANAPELLYTNNPLVQQVIQARQAAASQGAAVGPKPPSVSISFKDLPPDGQTQAAAQAGIQIDTNQIAATKALDAAAQNPNASVGMEAASNVPLNNA